MSGAGLSAENRCGIVSLGRTNYREVQSLQHSLVAARRAGLIDDVLLLTEHEPVITLGRSDEGNSLTVGRPALREGGIDLVECVRGGKATYHGPGQLVGYPIIDLRKQDIDLHHYLRLLEEVIIAALGDVGITAHRQKGMTGVWVEDDKIASIGVAIRGWVTFHGFALNLTCDLEPFEWFVPCGLQDVKMTAADKIRPQAGNMIRMTSLVVRAFCQTFGWEGYAISHEELQLQARSLLSEVWHE